MEDLRLAALLCTRLCHDLVGPVGAINNGLELLAEPGAGSDDDVVRLIRQSAGETARRLQYFRAAYGLPAGSGKQRALDRARELAGSFFAEGKLALDWPEAPGTAPAAEEDCAQLILNLLLCASETLPRGGRLAVRCEPAGDGFTLSVDASGPAIKIDAGLRSGLAGDREIAALGPREVQPHFTFHLAKTLGASLELTQPTDESTRICARTASTG
ncbi:MAG: histidine phosphotransferase family protein [Alphaproteobacteria bacterium]